MGIRKTRLISLISVVFLVCVLSEISFGKELIVYYRSPESVHDRRLDFIQEIITELLDRTVASDGPYTLKPLPKMVYLRLGQPKTQQEYPNFIVRLTADHYTADHFEVIPIPINRGIVGYRIFLIDQVLQNDFTNISSLTDLQASGLVAGQGRWTDVDILKENNLSVIEGSNYEGLFWMLKEGRFDYFPRGVNEIFQELADREAEYPEMQIEQTIALYYNLPRVLVTNKGNTAFADRIERGLRSIFNDGTHRKIWIKYNRDNLKKAKLGKRKIFFLKNSSAYPNLPYEDKEYWYQPGELQ
ncbi:MAG: hypothetical protein D6B25_01585 [Desulfobulbaceae bacterium]|nr:MAG: hypothetical protein D6B25_01585 [Desulfobulbaceae bacterium]